MPQAEKRPAFIRTAKEMPGYGPTHRHLIVALIEIGRAEEASSLVVELLRANPEYRNSTHLKMWRDQKFVNRYAVASDTPKEK